MPAERSKLPAAITPELLAEADEVLKPRLRSRPSTNPQILCACGCGGKLQRFDEYHRARKYIKGHNRRGAKVAKSQQPAKPQPLEGQRPAELVELAAVAARWDCGRATDDELREAARRI